MPMIEVDFDSWKEITRLRTSESESEGDVVRKLLKLDGAPSPGFEDYWETEGVRFRVGTKLEHRFRDGRIVEATITPRGIEYNGTIYSGLSPAGAAITNHQVNGWFFWFFRDETGRLAAADTLRKS
ncbi:MAG: hypothetical protein WBR13_14840 [Allosphingosinicella sp.]